MNTMTNWVTSGMAQEAARGLAWFIVIMFVVICVVLYRDWRKEEADNSKDYIFDPSQPVSKFQPPRSLDIAKTLIKEKRDE